MVRVAIRAYIRPRTPRLSTPFAHIRPYSDVAKPAADHSASSKLFADALREDAVEAEQASLPRRPSRLTQLETQHEHWTGDEDIQDVVLRMLIDKYKPLRSGSITTAEEKIRQAPPRVHSPEATHYWDPRNQLEDSTASASHPTPQGRKLQNMAEVPLLPSIEGHQPWHTTFRAPSHATSSIKYGHIPPPSSDKRPAPRSALDEKVARKEREQRKRTQTAGRLSGAKESALDYRLGLNSKTGAISQKRLNPVTLKGWASLVEDKIEKARKEGHFKTLKGRGKPLVQITDEKNPFIAREEFLMNRIVHRNGAAPPWVEIQGQLESAVTAFREVVKQSWARRAIRMLTVSQPLALLPKLTMTDVTALRDAEWEAREQGYHDSAIDDLNSLVRKYNGLAPYAVRRPYYMRSAELERAYRDSGEDILRGIADRVNGSSKVVPNARGTGREDDLSPQGGRVSRGSASEQGDTQAPPSLRAVIRRWISHLVGNLRAWRL